MNVYAKFRCAQLLIKKALGIYRELITATTTTRVAFSDPPSGSNNITTLLLQYIAGHRLHLAF